MLKQLNRSRVVELWLATCAFFSAALAVGQVAPSVTTVTVLVALSLIPVAIVWLWWPAEQRALHLDPLQESR